MLGGLKIKRDLSTWLGLVDGIYSISLTLLVIAFPETIRQFISGNMPGTAITPQHSWLKLDTSIVGLHALAILLIMFCVFLTTFDSWSIERRHLENAPVIDKRQGLYLSAGMFCSVLLPTIFLLRIESLHMVTFMYRLEEVDWLIAFLYVSHYLFLLRSEKRTHLYYSSRSMHRQARSSNFTVIAIRKRLYSSLLIAPIFVLLRETGAPIFISGLYPIILCMVIFDNSWMVALSKKIAIVFRSNKADRPGQG